MPKAKIKITDFSGGLDNKKHPTDIDETSASKLENLMADSHGKLRLMGIQSRATDITSVAFPTDITFGHGLFEFGTDYSISDNKPKNIRAFTLPQETTVGIYDSVSANGGNGFNKDEIKIVDNPDPAGISNIEHCFYNVTTNNTGGLRVSDGNFDNAIDYTKVYQYMKKTWFHGISDLNGADGISVTPGYDTTNQDSRGDWLYQSSYLYPPSVISTGAATHQLFSEAGTNGMDTDFDGSNANAVKLKQGCIAIKCSENHSTGDDGDWVQDSAMKFGVSFVYDDKTVGAGGGGQESLISNFAHTFNSTAAATQDDFAMKFDLYACLASTEGADGVDLPIAQADGNPDFVFDSRVIGINLYWTGDSNGDFEDPYFLLYWHWGTSDTDTPYIETHAGDRSTAFEYDPFTAAVDTVDHASNIINTTSSDITITQASNMVLNNSADATTGNRTLAGKGMATLYFPNTQNCYISGSGLS